MLQLFRGNQPIVTFFLLIYAILLHLSSFFAPVPPQPDNLVFFTDWLYTLIPYGSIVSNIIVIVLVFLQALMLNRLVNLYKLTKRPSFFPALFYLTVTALIPNFLYLHPALIANTFIIWMLIRLLSVYRVPQCADRIFDIGFWIAIASLFYLPSILFLLPAFIGLYRLRAFKLKEWLIVIIGLVIPYFLIWVIHFWNDNLYEFWLFMNNIGIGSYAQIFNNISLIYELLPLSLLFLWVLLNWQKYFYRVNIQQKKSIGIIFWLLLVAILSCFLQKNIDGGHLLIFTIPISILLSITFFNFRNKHVATTLYLLLFSMLLFLQYNSFFLTL